MESVSTGVKCAVCCRLTCGCDDGGVMQLNVKAVRKILRDAYKILKELPNVNRVPLESPEVCVTVVSGVVLTLRSKSTR